MADCSPSSKCGKSAACSGCASAPAPIETAKTRAIKKTLRTIRNTLFIMSGIAGQMAEACSGRAA